VTARRSDRTPHLQPLVALLVAALMAPPSALHAASYPFQSCFDVAARMHDVPVDLLLAVAATESAWDPDARSHANAHGIMQIQWPGTARHLGVRRVAELYNPCLNIELGSRYLRELLDANGGDLNRALAAYNYGPSRIAGESSLPDGARRYAAKVLKHRERISEQSFQVRADVLRGGVTFRSSSRAASFARSLNRQISTAHFDTVREAPGAHRVVMEIGAEGLSSTDVATLDALGWSSLGDTL
jgi:hypothetical protein